MEPHGLIPNAPDPAGLTTNGSDSCHFAPPGTSRTDPAPTGITPNAPDPSPSEADLAGPGPTYTVSDAARVLGCSERTVRKWIDRGRLPATMPDGMKLGMRIPVAAVEVLRQSLQANAPVSVGASLTPPVSLGPESDSVGTSPVQVLGVRLEGAQAAARLHAQRRREEQDRRQQDAARHQAELDREREERVKLEQQLAFLQERLVQAEQEGREMRLLMAQSVQAQQQTAAELQALREQAALPPAKVRWYWPFGRRSG
jgi:excisionase family DNA binding protein